MVKILYFTPPTEHLKIFIKIVRKREKRENRGFCLFCYQISVINICLKTNQKWTKFFV